MRFRDDVGVYECEECGDRVMVDLRSGEQPPDKCKACGWDDDAEPEPTGAGAQKR